MADISTKSPASTQQELATNMSRMSAMLQYISECLPSQDFRRSTGNSDENEDANHENQGANCRERSIQAEEHADEEKDRSRSFFETSDARAARKWLWILAP